MRYGSRALGGALLGLIMTLTFLPRAGAEGITVTAPRAGDVLAVGSRMKINWNKGGTTNWVRLEFSRDGGRTWKLLRENIKNDGSWTWVGVQGPESSRCVVRVGTVDGKASDTSGTFSVGTGAGGTSDRSGGRNAPPERAGAGGITVTAPRGGTWAVGTRQTIRWNKIGSIKNLAKIELSRDGGRWELLTQNIKNDGDWTWLVDGPGAPRCRVRVSAVNGSFSGISARFTVGSDGGGGTSDRSSDRTSDRGSGRNTPPEFDPIGDKAIPPGGTLTFRVTARDDDAGSLRYSASGLPSKASFSQDGEFSWRASKKFNGKRYNVTFTATDSSGARTS